MNARTDRRGLLNAYRDQAKEADRRGDVVIRRQASQTWREIATDAEAKRAPSYLTWPGRK
jgi:hypothetical protein